MRLIDADALKENVFFHEVDNESYVEEKDIDNTPTVDAVSVVRCKDCKHGRRWYKHTGEMYVECKMDIDPIDRDSDFFCADGERRSE